MPSGDAPSQAKRPAVNRRSSSSVSFAHARSPSESLSTSAQRRAPQRHVVHARMGSRVPSSTGRPKQQSKLNLAQLGDEIASPREAVSMKRNSSNIQLPRNTSATALKKNHSETSLKKNRSSGQLVKLPRAHSSKHISRGSKGEHKHKKSLSLARRDVAEEQEPEAPTVRFDLGDEDEDGDESWVEESLSQSPSTKANTARNSMINESVQVPASVPEASSPVTPSSPKAPTSPASPDEPDEGLTLRLKSVVNSNSESKTLPRPRPDARRSEPSNITSRLLLRNSSSQLNPQVSDVSATVKAEAHPLHHHQPAESESQSTTSTVQDNSGQELVSRFLNGGSSNGTPKGGNFMPSNSIEENEHEQMRRNQSTPNFMGRRHSRADSLPSGAGSAAVANPPSRTQQKLWLERDLSNIEPQQPARAPAFLRPNRLSGLGLPIYPGNSETRFSSQQRQLHEQTATEYKRVRMYQNPLAGAVIRIQAKSASKSRAAPKATSRVSFVGSGAGDGKYGLSQSWRSQKSARSSTTLQEKNGAADHNQKGRVRFGTSNLPSDVEPLRRSLDGATEVEYNAGDSRRDEARDLCRRLWELHPVATTNNE